MTVEIPDLKWDQDNKILQQIMAKFVKKDSDFAINVVSIGQINNVKETGGGFDFEKFVDSLPEPRFKNLMKAVVDLALSKFRYHKDAAVWLGITPRMIYYYRKKAICEVDDKLELLEEGGD